MNIEWSTFLPDIIVGIVTGGTVAAVLEYFSRSRDRLDSETSARTASEQVVHRLLRTLQLPENFSGDASIALLPRKWDRALGILEGSALDDWFEKAPTVLTVGLIELRSRLRDLDADAEDLGLAVERWVATHATAPGVSKFIHAKIAAAPSWYFERSWPLVESRATIAAESEAALDSSYVKRHLNRYRQADNRTRTHAGKLLPLLQSEMAAQSKERAAVRSRLGLDNGSAVPAEMVD